VSTRYTADGKRRSSMTHAQHGWTCPCGRKVWGNGGKSSHRRACKTWAEEALRMAEKMLAYWSDPANQSSGTAIGAELRKKYTAERDALRERLGLPMARGETE
jgi:hypothetical protein